MSTIGWKTTESSSGETSWRNEKNESRVDGLLSGRGGASDRRLPFGLREPFWGELVRASDFS